MLPTPRLIRTRRSKAWAAVITAVTAVAIVLPAVAGSTNAAAAGGALLQTFHKLLTTLVGSSLTERLLRSVWTNHFDAPSAQDT